MPASTTVAWGSRALIAKAFTELGAVVIGLAVLARLAGRWGITAIPFYLLAGLAVGEGGIAPLDVSSDFIRLAGDIGVLLLLLTLGLEYTADELRHGLRTGLAPGVVDAAANFTPGLLAGLLLGWEMEAALLLGGVCWISSSGVIAKVLSDLDRLGNRETPAILNLLVIEDLAMAAYLPVMAALLAGTGASDAVATVAISLAAVGAVLTLALRWGEKLSSLLARSSNEALLLSLFGVTLLVGGLAEQVQVSAAIGAFLVGLALSGPVQARAGALIEPLRDLFAATFFLFFSFQIRPGSLPDVIIPALLLAVVTGGTKLATGWFAARRIGVATPGRLRAGTALIARGEFSIVMASLGAATAGGPELRALAAGYVLLTATAATVATKHADRLTAPRPPPVPRHRA
jgi:CPA2 family monovalent cation:H+ antiporter-2